MYLSYFIKMLGKQKMDISSFLCQVFCIELCLFVVAHHIISSPYENRTEQTNSKSHGGCYPAE